jgi:hypothetical protein
MSSSSTWRPWQFDLSAHARPGENRIDLLITNMLANHLSTWSPTTWWSPDQLECGVLGSVTLWTAPESAPGRSKSATE